MPNTELPPSTEWLDTQQLRRAFERAASTYDAAAVLQREVGRRMLQRLDYVKLDPQKILDAGCGTGQAIRPLQERYHQAQIIAVDLAYNMVDRARGQARLLDRLLGGLWRRRMLPVCADINALPLAANSVQLLWSNLALQWCNYLQPVFSEFHRTLNNEGLLLFSTFGPDTLKELRTAFARIDSFTHVNRFIDMHDIGDQLVAAGFADPVMDMEYITLTYDTLPSLMRELKALGAHNITQGRPRGLQGKARWQKMTELFEANRREGKLTATFEVIYGHAWKPVPKKTSEGHAIVHFTRSTAR